MKHKIICIKKNSPFQCNIFSVANFGHFDFFTVAVGTSRRAGRQYTVGGGCRRIKIIQTVERLMHVGRMRSRIIVVASAVHKNCGRFQCACTLFKMNKLCGGRGR